MRKIPGKILNDFLANANPKQKGTLVEYLPPHPIKSWGTVEYKCEENMVDYSKTFLKEKGYCWNLHKDPATNIHTFNIFVTTNLTTGVVEPA